VRSLAVVGNLSKDTIDGIGPRVGGADVGLHRSL
jgi:hypothetical protein